MNNSYSSSNYTSNSGSDLRVVSEAAYTELVSLADAKNYLRVDNSDDDTLIENMIIQARIMAETYTRSDIAPKTREQFLVTAEGDFNLYYAPIATVNSVMVDGVENTTYETLGLSNPFIRLDGNGMAKNVLVNYTTSGRTEVGLKQGILCTIAYLYYGRDAKMSTNYKPFLAPYKISGYYGVR